MADFDFTVSAVIFNAEGKVLLIHENYGRRRYGFPGGSVEPGEGIAEAVIREVCEETCCTVRVDHVIGTYFFADTPFQAFALACTIIDGGPRLPETEEIDEVGWFDPSALPRPQTRVLQHALADVLAGTRGVVRCIEPNVNEATSHTGAISGSMIPT